MIGDVYGSVGRNVIKNALSQIVNNYNIDIVILNGENTTHGKSISKEHYTFYKKLGVDVITSGNHIFRLNEVVGYISSTPDLLRPLNFYTSAPGNGTYCLEYKNKVIRVTNLMGRSFMDNVNNPYEDFDNLLENDDSDIHVVDFHAEATAEKIAFAWNYDGKINGLVGTHTHVQTADNRVLPKGTAFISDLGMCGSLNSIIGGNPTEIIQKEKSGLPARFKPSNDNSLNVFSAVIIDVDNKNNKTQSIERLYITSDNLPNWFKGNL